ALSRLPAPALPPPRGTLRGERGARVGVGGGAGGDPGRAAAPPLVPRPRGLRAPLQSLLHALRPGLGAARQAGGPPGPGDSSPRPLLFHVHCSARLPGWLAGVRACRPVCRVRLPAHGQGVVGAARPGARRERPETIMTPARERVLSGMRPTGQLHLGNFLGALENWVKLQDQFECFYFVANWHVLTTNPGGIAEV